MVVLAGNVCTLDRPVFVCGGEDVRDGATWLVLRQSPMGASRTTGATLQAAPALGDASAG